MSAEWSEWHRFIQMKCNPAEPYNRGVYQVRATYEDRRPIPIQRACDTDADGIIYIGEGGLPGGVLRLGLEGLALADHFTGRDVQRREQARRAVPDVVVRVTLGRPAGQETRPKTGEVVWKSPKPVKDDGRRYLWRRVRVPETGCAPEPISPEGWVTDLVVTDGDQKPLPQPLVTPGGDAVMTTATASTYRSGRGGQASSATGNRRRQLWPSDSPRPTYRTTMPWPSGIP